MKPKYRAEKIDGKWYAMRGDGKASPAFRTRKEADVHSIKVMDSDLRYEATCQRLGSESLGQTQSMNAAQHESERNEADALTPNIS